jgi:hypothetical protein
MTYIEAISLGFPDVQCHALGDLYEDIIHDAGSPIPDKITLEQWMVSNPNLYSDYKITVLAFRNRFTKTEKITMDLASIDNVNATMQQRQLAAAIRVDIKDSDNATYIDLQRPETRAGVNALETYGIISTGRSAIILDTPITPIERYYG